MSTRKKQLFKIIILGDSGLHLLQNLLIIIIELERHP